MSLNSCILFTELAQTKEKARKCAHIMMAIMAISKQKEEGIEMSYAKIWSISYDAMTYKAFYHIQLVAPFSLYKRDSHQWQRILLVVVRSISSCLLSLLVLFRE